MIAVTLFLLISLCAPWLARGAIGPSKTRLQRHSPLQIKLRKALTVLLPSRLHVDSPEMYEFIPFDPMVPHHWAGWYWHFPPPDWDTPWAASREMLRGMIGVVHTQMRAGDFESAADVLEDMGSQFAQVRQRPSLLRPPESRELFGNRGMTEVLWETFNKDSIRYIEASGVQTVPTEHTPQSVQTVDTGAVTQSVDSFRFIVNATQLEEASKRRQTFLLSQAHPDDSATSEAAPASATASASASARLADRLVLDASLLEALEDAEIEETESNIIIRQTMTPEQARRFLVRAGQGQGQGQGDTVDEAVDVDDADQPRRSPFAASMAAAALAGQLRRSPLPPGGTSSTSSSSSKQVAGMPGRPLPPPGIPFWYWQMGDHCDYFVDLFLHPVETYKNFCFVRSRTIVGLRSRDGEPPEMRGAVAGTALALGAVLAVVAAQNCVTAWLAKAVAPRLGGPGRAGLEMAPWLLGLAWSVYEVWMLFCTPLWGCGKVMKRAERAYL